MMYFFDLIHLFKIILLTNSYRVKIHIKLTHFVDRFNELYHFMI